MRKLLKFGALLGTTVMLLLSGCVEENFENGNSGIPKGNGIVFGATAGYASDPDTKTEYGDYEIVGGEKVSQEINWLETDRVEIYSPTSPNNRQVEYGVTLTGSQNKNSAYLVALGDGLQWARPDVTQDFYAIYPSVASIQNEYIKNNYVSFENGVLTGYVPINQQHTITKSSNGFTAVPNMDYLYMAGIQKEFPIPEENAENDGISLEFMPLTTTLEITIEGPTTVALASLNVEANGVPVVGQFRCDLVNGEVDSQGYPSCESLQHGTVNDYATVSLYYNDNGTQRPLELASGESITLNVFLLPTEPINNVTIRIAGFNTADRQMSLVQNNTNITLNPHKKTCVTIPAPDISSGETNTWITNINDNVLVSQLSIPGTANSFSYLYSGSNPDWYKTQTANITTQWNAGIRCFELRGPNNVDGDDLAGAPLQCNRQNIGITFGDAVYQINSLLSQNPGEFAMIIPAFESGAGRFVEDYANDLNNFFRNHTEYKYVTYGRNLTVGEARGGLMFIARITSEEDAGTVIDDPVQGVFIDEWGSLKDNWARRGYPVLNWGQNAFWGDVEQMEYYMINGNRSGSFVPTGLPVKGTVDYMHDTQRNDDTEGTAYIQDWSRVVSAEGEGNYPLYSHYRWSVYHYEFSYTQYAYWRESFTEKCNDVWNTFERAIADNNNQQGSTFYINSLDGYFVDASILQSYTPYIADRSDSYHTSSIIGGDETFSYGQGGMAGNIGAFAEAINQYFYNAILDYGANNIYGPMNIVILDRVYADEPSSYLPSVILNNNFRFPLITSDDVSGTTSYNATYQNGGNAIGWDE